jgi:hypothetical protein
VTQFQNHTGSHAGALPLLAGVLLTLFCASACASGATSSGSSSPTPGTTGVNRSTPGAALKDWLQKVVRGDYNAACEDMDGSFNGRAKPAPYSAADCVALRPVTTLTDLHSNFAVDGITPKDSIMVTGVHIRGTSAMADGTGIYVSGRTLNSFSIARSGGVNPGGTNLSCELTRFSGAWYVTSWSIVAA